MRYFSLLSTTQIFIPNDAALRLYFTYSL
jgi:hypothetical protein